MLPSQLLRMTGSEWVSFRWKLAPKVGQFLSVLNKQSLCWLIREPDRPTGAAGFALEASKNNEYNDYENN
jgi:hypothetical protein